MSRGVLRVFTLLLLLGPCVGGSCEGPGGSSTPPDPWKEKIDKLRREYEANIEKLKADWTRVLEEVQRGTLNADRLLGQTIDLRQQLQDSARQLEQWNREVSDELRRRGQTPE